MTAIALDSDVRRLAGGLVEFLETGTPPEGLFAEDVFCDLTIPHWRLQAEGIGETVGLRHMSHPGPGKVLHTRIDETATGFVLEFDESWDDDKGTGWYARQLMRADVTDGKISQLSVYCTGDWDEARQAEHRATVELLRP
ncbi:MAG TPA: hypothetical protein VGQ38_19440 [Gaiellaceae bacterium]|jgi:hypothetical protein|nr:hypothetical protein [Gaiellaceae bacterium]